MQTVRNDCAVAWCVRKERLGEVSSGNGKRLMVEATRGGGGREGDRRVYFERLSQTTGP